MNLGEALVTHLKRRRAYLQAASVLLTLLGRLLRVVRFRRLRLDLALGTGDPASTGMAKGAAEAAAGLARAKGAPVSLRFRPVFGRRSLEVDGEVELSLAPIDLARALGATARAALRKRELRRLAFRLIREALRALLADDGAGPSAPPDAGDPSESAPESRPASPLPAHR